MLGAEVSLAGSDYKYARLDGHWSWRGKRRSYFDLPNPPNVGSFIFQNAAAVLMVLEHLHDRLPVAENHIKQGLLTLHVPGRFQVLSTPVTMVLDVAHNPEASNELALNLGDMTCSGRTLALFSALEDKSISDVVAPLSKLVDHWYIGELEVGRAASARQLESAIIDTGVMPENIDSFARLSDAAIKAMADVQTHDRLVVFGSFYTVATIMQHPGIEGYLNKGTSDQLTS